MKSKDQVLDVFKDFHVKIERQTGKQLKYVIADNGGEYRRPFEQYCKSHGIKLEKTVPKTPQQNGVAERMNRTTVIESGVCSLMQNCLSLFWVRP